MHIMVGTVTALLVLGAGTGVAIAGRHDGDTQISGTEADRATEAALAATHGGRANAVERDSENGATWEVEITKPNGRTVDVRLDANYRTVVIEGDHETATSR